MKNTDKRHWIGLVFISLAVSLIIVDSTILSVAVPAIVEDLNASSSQVQWLQETYTLVFASLLLIFGGTADRFGRRLLTIIGVSIFVVASLLAAFAASIGLLIVTRILQGIGCAMVLPGTLSLINALFQGKERGIAFAIWGSTIGGMAAVGPVLGGWLVSSFSWRWVFGINIPLGLVIVLGILLTVPESKESTTRKLDFIGAILAGLGAGSLVFALIEGRTYGWWKTRRAFGPWDYTISPIPVMLVVFFFCLIGFILWTRHRERSGKDPLLAMSLFSLPSFRNGNIVAMMVSLGEFGLILSLPLWLQFSEGFTALQSGMILMTIAIGSFLASGVAASTSSKVSATFVVRCGLLSEILGLLLAAWAISTDLEIWALIIPLMIYGFGVGLATAQLTGIILIDVPVDKSGQGSGTQSTSRQFGSALGIAVLGTLLFTIIGHTLDNDLQEIGLPEATSQSIVTAVVDSAGSAIDRLSATNETVATAAKGALTKGTQAVSFGAAGFLTLGLLASFSLESRPPESKKQPLAKAKK